MSIQFILDSTTHVSKAVEHRFRIVPLTVHFGAQEYLDGVTISGERFYEMLVECDTLPTTSQPTPDAYIRAYDTALKEADHVIVLTVASNLSGTYQSATIAAAEFPAGKIFVVDTHNVAIAAGILAELALQMADSGMCAEEIVAELERKRTKLRLVALVDTLEYLQKGGRLSKTVAFAGTLLSIKPVIALDKGEIKVLGKARGSKQGNNLLVQQIEQAGGVDFSKPLLLGYTGLSDHLLKKYIEDSGHLWKNHRDEPEACLIGSVIGTHIGPGAVAVAFFQQD